MKLLYSLTSFALVLLFIAGSGCERKYPEKAKPAAITPQPSKSEKINFEETRLAEIPADYDKLVNITFSADGRQVFYGAVQKGKNFVVVGNEPGKAYDDASFMVQSADGRRFAFGGVTGGKKHLVVDNKELKDLSHEEVAPASFSPDGRFVACEVGGLKEKKWFILVSDGEKKVYRSQVYRDTWRQPVFSPDGRLLVYELGDDKRKIENKKKKHVLSFLDVSAGKIVKERLYTGYHTGSFSFSADSSRVIYDIRDKGKIFLVLNDFAVNKERTVELPYPAGKFLLSPDGNQIISVASKEGKQYLVVSPWESPAQGKEYGPYEGIVSPVFGPDSKMPVFHAMKEGKWRRVVGDKEGAQYDGMGGAPVFSSGGVKMAYPAMKDSADGHHDQARMMDGKWTMIVSPAGRPEAVTEGPVYDMVITPVFSPDGRRIAYRARKGSMDAARRFIVIADAETGKVIKEGPVQDEIWPPVWSPDGKAVAYGARQGRELWWRVVSVK